MNIAAPLAVQGGRGLYGYVQRCQLRASMVVAALGLIVVLFALLGLRSTWMSETPRDVRNECLAAYNEYKSDRTYGRCDQRCARGDGGGDGRDGAGQRRAQANELLRSRVLDLGKTKIKGKTKIEQQVPYWVAVVGDSIARNVLIALMDTSGIDMDTVTFERHQDFERVEVASNMRWTLHWAPFPKNATDVVTTWLPERASGKSSVVGGLTPNERPDAVIVSTSLWHVLWIHDVDAYREEVVKLVGAVEGLRMESSPVMLNGPFVFGEKLEDAQKKMYMVESRIAAYNSVLQQAVCGHDAGDGNAGDHPQDRTSGARVKLVDVCGATTSCGPVCSIDGIHSQENVYSERIVPMVLDALNISRGFAEPT